MSNFTTTAINPYTGNIEIVQMLDNYFGQHEYGVKLQTGEVLHESKVTFPAKDISSTTGRQICLV